ncbi:MAG: SagB/ThcOx family dehydrogenase, partial [Candidatus Hydrogenedentota bacterium]
MPGASRSPLDVVIDYHEATKHHPTRPSRGPGYLDWANQPKPFRRFEGAEYIGLPLAESDETPPYEDLYRPGAITPVPLTRENLGLFFECSLAVSAWKAYKGHRWALRCNPSSGNLHPTEGYLIAPPLEGLHAAPAVYHYAPDTHGLERRTALSSGLWERLTAGFPEGAFLVGLTSIIWREAWKYGERAYRYCQHDAGHALGALSFAAAMLGWRCVWLQGMGDQDAAALMGVDREADFPPEEREEPALIAAVVPRDEGVELPLALPRDAVAAVAAEAWEGQAGRLSEEHVQWRLIDEAAEACRKRPEPLEPASLRRGDAPPEAAAEPCGLSARAVILQRRSAVAMDGLTGISRERFYTMLQRLMPGHPSPPLEALPDTPRVHLLLFVHRVEQLLPGVYILPRAGDGEHGLRQACEGEFEWAPAEGRPDGVPLYRLAQGMCEELATQVSLFQEIAGESAFSLGMLAEFEEPLQQQGPWYYRRLFWETGLIGQILYIEAEAAGLRGTGIGAFFDDTVREVAGITGLRFQPLYHFTVGGPVEDPRLSTLP